MLELQPQQDLVRAVRRQVVDRVDRAPLLYDMQDSLLYKVGLIE